MPHATVAQGAAAIRAAFDALRPGGFRARDRRCDRGPRSRGDRRGRGRFHADHRRLGHRARPAGEFPPPGSARRRRRRRRPAARSTGAAAVLSGLVLGGDAGAGRLYARARAGLHDRPDRGRGGTRRRGEALDWAAPRLGERPVLISRDGAARRGRRGPAAARPRARRRAGRGDRWPRIARGLVERGVRRLVVAGGETSGAVVQALGVTGLRIGRQIDPGVPWTVSLPASPANPLWRWRSNPAISARPISSCAPFRCCPERRERQMSEAESARGDLRDRRVDLQPRPDRRVVRATSACGSRTAG